MAASRHEAVQGCNQHRPDVRLMDLDLPSAAGITAHQEILKIDPAACVLGLFTYEEDESCAQALRAGARSCIAKDRLNQDPAARVRDCARPAGYAALRNSLTICQGYARIPRFQYLNTPGFQ